MVGNFAGNSREIHESRRFRSSSSPPPGAKAPAPLPPNAYFRSRSTSTECSKPSSNTASSGHRGPRAPHRTAFAAARISADDREDRSSADAFVDRFLAWRFSLENKKAGKVRFSRLHDARGPAHRLPERSSL